MNRSYIILSFLLGSFTICYSQSFIDTSIIQTTQLEERTFDQNRLDQQRSQSRFDYSDSPEFTSSFIEDWILKMMRKFKPDYQPNLNRWRAFFRGFQWLLGLSIIVFIVYLITKGKLQWLFKKVEKPSAPTIEPEVVDESSNKDYLHQLLRQAEQKQQYRMALRLRFLIMLHELEQKGAINIKPEKTNQQYLTELRTQSNYKNIKEAFKIYEYCWYGLFDIVSETEYRRLASYFGLNTIKDV